MGRANPVLRMAGSRRLSLTEISVRSPTRFKQRADGRKVPEAPPPYIPKSLKEPLHPGGNSLCYGIQIAHLMGADEIVALGFTLRSNTPYEHGKLNPATNRPSLYIDDHVDRVLDFCSWYEGKHPGVVKLGPEWDGPLREVFSVHA